MESWEAEYRRQAELYAQASQHLANVVAGQGPTDDVPWTLDGAAITVMEYVPDERGAMLAELEDNLEVILYRNGYQITWEGWVTNR